MYRIFVVEDDPVIARSVEKHLSSWGYSVALAQQFDQVLSELLAFDPHLVILDITLPFFNGYHWCAKLRTVSKAPVLFLTSASDTAHVVMAMEMGGDDLLAKPFDLQVLSAKVSAMLRRSYDFTPAAPRLVWGDAVLNLEDGSFTAGDIRVSLTKNERRILQLLLEARGRTVSRDTLMLRLWETDSFVDENTLSVNVNRLRKKLAPLGLGDKILTRKGEGYCIE